MVTKEQVIKVAKLACLDVASEEVPVRFDQLNSVLEWIECLHEVDVSSHQPLINPLEITHNVQTPTRLDDITDGGYPECILSNAPQQQDGYFVVPKVIE